VALRSGVVDRSARISSSSQLSPSVAPCRGRALLSWRSLRKQVRPAADYSSSRAARRGGNGPAYAKCTAKRSSRSRSPVAELDGFGLCAGGLLPPGKGRSAAVGCPRPSFAGTARIWALAGHDTPRLPDLKHVRSVCYHSECNTTAHQRQWVTMVIVPIFQARDKKSENDAWRGRGTGFQLL